MHFVNSFGTESTRVYRGLVLKDFLIDQNVDVAALKSGATLTARASDGETVTYGYGDIVSGNTLLAWEEDGRPLGADAPRLCPGDNPSANMYLKGVVSVTLYN